MLEVFEINNEKLVVDIHHRVRGRKYGLYIKNHRLCLATPYEVKEKEVLKMLKNNYSFIKKHLPETKKIQYLGNLYDYEIRLSSHEGVDFSEQITIYTKKNEVNHIENILKKAYNEKTKYFVESLIEQILEDFKEDLNQRPTLKYSYLTSAYGICYPTRNIVKFSGSCAKLPLFLLELIVYHEFCHFKYHSHKKEFYFYLESKLKGALSLTKELRKQKIYDFAG